MTKPGSDFELAVERFARTLDKSAKVYHDHKVRDRDTGSLRQCDVWIEALFGGHYPLSILISCKDWPEKKLDIGDIGTFCDEVRSTGATFGVIYSRKGFSEPALAKAKANSICCCRLFQDQPSDIPDALPIHFYVASPRLGLKLLSGNVQELQLSSWGELIQGVPGLADHLEKAYSNLEDFGKSKLQQTRCMPEGVYSEHELVHESLVPQ